MPCARFPRVSRLRSNSAFRSVIAHRMRLSDSLLVVCVAPNGLQTNRLGISVGSAHGSAVQRNRLKRLIREVWRKNQHQMSKGYDYVVMPAKKNRASLPTYQEVDASLVALMEKLMTRSEKE